MNNVKQCDFCGFWGNESLERCPRCDCTTFINSGTLMDAEEVEIENAATDNPDDDNDFDSEYNWEWEGD